MRTSDGDTTTTGTNSDGLYYLYLSPTTPASGETITCSAQAVDSKGLLSSEATTSYTIP